MDHKKYRRFGVAIYLLIFSLSIIIAFWSIHIVKEGPYYDLGLNVAAGLFGTALTFFLVTWFFLYDPESERLGNAVHELQRLLNSFNYTEVQSTSEEVFQQLKVAYRKSEKRILVVSWKNMKAQLSEKGAQEYIAETITRLNSPPPIEFRWILWNEEHLHSASQSVMSGDGFNNAEIGFLVPPNNEEITIVPCVIVDDVVNFGWGYLGLARIDQVNITVKHSEAVEAFYKYFAFLWQNCIIVKKKGERYLNADQVYKAQAYLDSLRGTSVQLSPDKAYDELGSAYQTSQKSIDVISWHELEVQPTDMYKKKYFEALDEHVRKNPVVSYRRLLWRRQHLDFLEKMADTFDEFPNMEIVYFDLTKDNETPVIPCVIIDSDTVNFGWGYLGRQQMDAVNITLNNRAATQTFANYFSYLWQNGIPLKKQGKKVERYVLTKLRQPVKRRKRRSAPGINVP